MYETGLGVRSGAPGGIDLARSSSRRGKLRRRQGAVAWVGQRQRRKRKPSFPGYTPPVVRPAPSFGPSDVAPVVSSPVPSPVPSVPPQVMASEVAPVASGAAPSVTAPSLAPTGGAEPEESPSPTEARTVIQGMPWVMVGAGLLALWALGRRRQ